MKQIIAGVVLFGLNMFLLFLGQMVFTPLVGEQWWTAISFVESLIAGWWIGTTMGTWYFAEKELKRWEER